MTATIDPATEDELRYGGRLFEDLRDALPGIGHNFRVTDCPLHADFARTLRITPMLGERVALACLRGCPLDGIVAGLPLGDELRARLAAGAVAKDFAATIEGEEAWDREQAQRREVRAQLRLDAGLLSLADVCASHGAAWLVEGVLLQGALAAIVGPPASLKSFLALDLALSVAGGQRWAGRATASGPVAYIAAEGGIGLKQRLQAWMADRRPARTPAIEFITRPLDLLDPWALQPITRALAEVRPALIVIDTLARTIGEGNESATASMNSYVAACDELRAATGAAVLVLHHTGKARNGPRGSTALEGALDTLIDVGRHGDRLDLRCAKMKDAPDFPRITLKAREVRRDGVPLSIVLDHAQPRAGDDPADRDLSPRDRTALAALGQLGGHATFTAWLTASGQTRTTFRRSVAALMTAEYVRQEGDGKGATYGIIGATPDGPVAPTLAPIMAPIIAAPGQIGATGNGPNNPSNTRQNNTFGQLATLGPNGATGAHPRDGPPGPHTL